MSAPGAPLLEARGLCIEAGGRRLVDRLDLELAPGEFLAVLGRNGAGKSLTLGTLAGLRAPAAGELLLEGRAFAAWPRREVARRLAWLPQDAEESLALRALESVLLARHPHLPWWRAAGAGDERLAHEALARLGVEALGGRELGTLSGGERRRVALAALLAQAPRGYLLDEPGNHLDPHQEVLVLEAFAARCARGECVLAAVHDAGAAARHAHRVLLLHGDGRWQLGPASELLGAEALSALYGTPMLELGSGSRRAFIPA